MEKQIDTRATELLQKPVNLEQLKISNRIANEKALQLDKNVVGGYSGTFPLTSATQGGIYLLPSTGKFYVCDTAYNGTQISAPNSNFVELSVWKNHDRLNNLDGRLANLNNVNKTEINLGEHGSIFLFKIHKIVFAYVSVYSAIDIKNIIPEMYRPLLTSRNSISNYLSDFATFTISIDGDVKTIKTDDSNYVGSFCYFTL